VRLKKSRNPGVATFYQLVVLRFLAGALAPSALRAQEQE
jgi:hypothetical protein